MSLGLVRARVTRDGKCPYCDYGWSVDLVDVTGRNFALRCPDCEELYIVEVTVIVTHEVHTVAGVDVDEVLERLMRPRRLIKIGPFETPPDDAPDTRLTLSSSDSGEPAPDDLREHVNTALCWCRDRPANESNPWCELVVDKRRSSVSDEKRAAICEKYDAAKAANGGRAPHGLLAELVEEFECTPAQVRDFVYSRRVPTVSSAAAALTRLPRPSAGKRREPITVNAREVQGKRYGWSDGEE